MVFRPSRLPQVAATCLGLIVLVAVSGCSSLGGTDEANFVVGDGSVVEIAPADRSDPIEISGPSLEG
ncbi:MAG: hypothetical protein WB471_13640, partial [Nocardioides sp.]